MNNNFHPIFYFDPFGLKHGNYNVLVNSLGNSLAQKLEYNSKEFEEASSYNMNEMDWRHYDPALGRFNCIDKLAETSYLLTPYHFGYNNPIVFSDPSGLQGIQTNYGVDWKGRDKYDGNGLYITPDARGEERAFSMFNYMDGGNGYGGVRLGTNGYGGFSSLGGGGYYSSPFGILYADVYTYGIVSSDIEGAYGDSGSEITREKVEIFNQVNAKLGGFGLGWGTKEIIIQGAVANARGINIAKVTNLSNIRALGTSGARYMNIVKQVSRGANLLGAGMTIADGVTNGFQAHHAADLGIQATIYGLSASVPVAGWIIGGAYFVGDMYFQSTHDGKSITQYYLD